MHQQPVYRGHPPPQQPSGGMPTWAIVLVVGGLALVALFGVCAAIAVPAMTKYMRRSKTSEARVQIARIFDRVQQYYGENAQCPTDGRPTGEAGVTPPLSVNCNDGPGGRCVPGMTHESSVWTDNEVWKKLDEPGPIDPHYFHYNFRWGQQGGQCMFTVQAFGDLDDDGIYSTYERAGAADELGVNAAAGLYIDNEIE